MKYVQHRVFDTPDTVDIIRAMRSLSISENEYYHLCNRSNDRSIIFRDKRDYVRFLFLVLYFQSPLSFPQINRPVTNFVKHSVFDIDEKMVKKILACRFVQLIGFAFMPNHFHLLVCEYKEGGISRYMQKVLNAYTKYYNTKYKKIGHLFSGPYRAVHIEDNEQLLHVSAYVHRNPRELREWLGKEGEYSWSSYQDYTNQNRWAELLEQDIILSQFKNAAEYEEFLQSSGTKETEVRDPLL